MQLEWSLMMGTSTLRLALRRIALSNSGEERQHRAAWWPTTLPRSSTVRCNALHQSLCETGVLATLFSLQKFRCRPKRLSRKVDFRLFGARQSFKLYREVTSDVKGRAKDADMCQYGNDGRTHWHLGLTTILP